MMSFGATPEKLVFKHAVKGEKDEFRVFEFKRRWQIRVHRNGDVSAIDLHHRQIAKDDPRNTLPNMEILEDEIRIPICDLVELILLRLDPADLAKQLWIENDSVRDEFMECLATRFSSDNISDNQRREILARCKEAVHDAALDKLVNLMFQTEFERAKAYRFSAEINRVNETLRAMDVRLSDDRLLQIPWSEPDFDISGKNWNEARAFWRETCLERFPKPVPADVRMIIDDVLTELRDAIDGAEESKSHDSWLSELIRKLERI